MNLRNRRFLVAAWCGVLVLAASGVAARAAGEWPQFRGPTGQGIGQAKNLPASWNEKEHVAWKTPVHGKAWSSPVVWGDQVWLTSATEDGKQLFVLCVDRGSGKVLRDVKLYDIANPQYCIPFNSYASPTPVIEEGRLYVTWGAPATACLDTRTGEKLWERRDLKCNHFRSAGSSPILYGDLLLMNFDGSDYQYVIALDKKTGSTVWKTDRSIDFQDLDASGKPKAEGDERKAFSTPRIATFNGQTILISQGSKALYAYDPATGKELWRVENRAAHSGSGTPVVGPDLVYFNTGHGRQEVWAVRPGGSGVVTNTHVAWKAKNAPTRSSVLLVDDLLYFVNNVGLVTCLDAHTGEEIWTGRIKGKEYSASPVYADGKIYFFAEDGRATAIAPGRQFKILGESQLDDGFMASPAVADNALFLRTKTHLYRIENKPS